MLLNRCASPQELASQRTTAVLLNCYLREYAQPAGAWRLAGELELRSLAPSLRQLQAAGCSLMRLEFPRTHQVCWIAVGPGRSNPDYRSQPYSNSGALSSDQLAEWIVAELAAAHDQPGNQELLDQVRNSFERMCQFYAHPLQPGGTQPLDNFLLAEQSLTAGHAHHPAPKSRQGMSDEELLRYSPEVQARFRMFYFAVREEGFMHRTSVPQPQWLEQQASDAQAGHTRLLPIHPWQAAFLLSHPVVQEAVSTGWLMPLGPLGPEWSATSSVRTLFRPDRDYFLKLSLHVRLTNCLRKNAWYELESALLLDRLLRDLSHPWADFGILAEPAYSTADLPHLDTESRLFLREAFSTLYRDSRPLLQTNDSVVMAAALFGGTGCRNWLQDTLPRSAEEQLQWFADYCRAVVWPSLYYYAEHGVVFEPHLQNTLVRLRQGRPVGAIFRDLEGTKLLADRWADRLPRGTVSNSVLYSAEQAWRRFTYCIVFNQLWEVVDQLQAVPPRELWRTCRETLLEYLQAYGSCHSLALVQRLLSEPTLPLKANLTTRFLQARDRDAAYVSVENPLLP